MSEKKNKVSINEFADFQMRFHNGAFPHQRFGQAFVNKFLEGTHTDLFYCDREADAKLIIWNRYIDLDDEENLNSNQNA